MRVLVPLLGNTRNEFTEHFNLPTINCAMFKSPLTGEYFFDISQVNGERLITVRAVSINHEENKVNFESSEITFGRGEDNLIKSSLITAHWASLDQHKFLKYSEAKPKPSLAKQLAAYLLNHNKNPNNPPTTTYHQYEKAGTINVTAPNGTHQLQFRFEELVEHIRSSRSVQLENFKLNRPMCPWLDLQVHLGLMIPPRRDSTGELRIQIELPLGATFPLKPGVDREGAIFSSFQVPIQQNILQLHKSIVEESHLANHATVSSWMNSLRMLINECVSIVDITLHQLYLSAEYGLKHGTPLNWKFEPEKLGQRHGLRIKDKLHWITLITGNVLGDAEKEVDAFNELREVRNHFSHFDPPCVALSVEDAMRWLNLVPIIGQLLWKIRDKLNAQLTPVSLII